MVRYTLTLILYFFFHSSFAIQECDNSPGIFGFLSLFGDDDNYESNESHVYSWDTVRTEDFELRVGANFLVPTGIEGMRPGGVELGFYQAVPNRSGLYLGGSVAFYNHGFQSYDTLFEDYDHINTSHNIYGISFHMKQRVIDTNWFKAYFGLQTGLLFFHSFSKAVDLSYPCEDRELGTTLHSQFNVKPTIGPTMDLQFPVSSIYDRISIHIGYKLTGSANFVKKGDVEIAPNRINFLESKKQLGLLNFQIGYSHFF